MAGQLHAITTGFWEVVPCDVIRSFFTATELELVLAGMPDIDVDDWEDHCTYWGYPDRVNSDHPMVVWWWEIVRSMAPAEQALLLQFCTGTSRVPVRGFAALEASAGELSKFQVRLVNLDFDGQLPKAHTCFNRIDLPRHTSKMDLERAIRVALAVASTGFSDE